MRILDYLTGPQGQQAIGNLAGAFGIPPAQAKAALEAIVPELAHSVERNTLNRGGIADLVSALGRAPADQALEPGTNLASPAVTAHGIEALDQIFGSKGKSRAVAARVSRETGLDESIIKTMLPAAAALTMSALAKGSRGPLQDIAAKFPGLTASGPLSMPDAGGGGSLPQQTPLPIPGDSLPDLDEPQDERRGSYDDLSDVIRRGGTRLPAPSGAPSGGGTDGDLGGSIRDILGNLLGFKNRGFLGWLFQAIILPMVLRTIQSVLRRLLTGR